MPNIEYFIVDNVNIKETWTESKPSKGSKTRLLNIGKHNAGTDFTIDRFEITNSDIVLPSTVLMMSDASEGVTTINHIRIDNCLVSGINDTKNVTKQFGFIHAINKGSNVWNDVSVTNSTNVWNDVSVTNSTFYEFYIHRVCLEHLLLMSLLRPVTKLLFLIVLSIIGAQIRMAKTLIGLLGISPN